MTELLTDKVVVIIKSQRDIIAARQAGRNLAGSLGLSRTDQTRIATAISELTRNVTQHCEEGTCTIYNMSDSEVIHVKIVVEDHGPGIPDIEQAMQDGFTTSNGLGAGLPGTKRLMTDFDIKSSPGHTIITFGLRKTRK